MVKIDFTGRTAIITGAAGAIGSGIAKVFAKAGASLAICDMREDALIEAAGRLRTQFSTRVEPYLLNITDTENIYQVSDKVAADFGGIDFFIHSAGAASAANGDGGKFNDVSMEAAETLVQTNIMATGHFMKSVLKHMLPRSFGRIVLVASIAGRYGVDHMPWYGATKAAMIHLAQTVARSHAKEGITCNAICPGVVMSGMMKERMRLAAKRDSCTYEEAFHRFIDGWCPQGEPQEPQDMGNAAAFFCSDLGRHVNGQTLNVCGGARVN